MPEKEKEIKDPESIVQIVEKILKFNKQNQQGQGIKKNTNTKANV